MIYDDVMIMVFYDTMVMVFYNIVIMVFDDIMIFHTYDLWWYCLSKMAFFHTSNYQRLFSFPLVIQQVATEHGLAMPCLDLEGVSPRRPQKFPPQPGSMAVTTSFFCCGNNLESLVFHISLTTNYRIN